MGTWQEAKWQPKREGAGIGKQPSGVYKFYVPDKLADRVVRVPGQLDLALADAEAKVRNLAFGPDADDLRSIARLFLRIEAVASADIRDLRPRVLDIAAAEFAQREFSYVRGLPDDATKVARNMSAIDYASHELGSKERIDLADVIDVHEALMGEDYPHLGLRTTPKWFGGREIHPFDAKYVAPSSDLVEEYVEDVVTYMNGAKHGTLLQAALVQAQFEAIQPFTLGNGRVGRMLAEMVVTRRGIAPMFVVPFSMILAENRSRYFDALLTYWHAGEDAKEQQRALNAWLEFFVWAVGETCAQCLEILNDVRDLRESWEDRIDDYRNEEGRTRRPRQNSAVMQIMHCLPNTPVHSARTAAELLDVTPHAARRALEILEGMGILTQMEIGGNARTWVSKEVLFLR